MFQMPYLPKTLSPTNFRIIVVRSEMMAGSISIRCVNGNRESLIKRCSKRFVRVSREI